MGYYNKNNKGNNQNWKSQPNNGELQVKTPYAFVPISDDVYYPEWAKKISMDIPFKYGLSGIIEFNLIANTPIGVLARNGECSVLCRTTDGRYFLPSTSIKGAIRGVMDIFSFGKIKNVQDSRFGIRDLRDPNYRNNMKGILCGWLYKYEDGYKIDNLGEPGRIALAAIGEKYNVDFRRIGRNAGEKYTKLEKKSLKGSFIEDRNLQKKMKGNTRKFYKFCDSGGKQGTIVFTGQPNSNKKFEFVFFDNPKSGTISVSKDVFANLFMSMNESSPDYKIYWSKKIGKGEKIPVFFKLKDDGSIHSIGLSYMHKYPYNNSVSDAIPAAHKTNSKDLSECIFGYTSGDDALRGRVQFSHAIASTNQPPIETSVTPASPKASFYPFYVKDGKDWNHAKTISGFKRYPIHQAVNNKNGKAQTISLLDKGTIFKERVRFHNLRPEELGALLSALTFHNNEKTCFHNIGYGKPYGYGSVKLENLSLKDTQGCDLNPAEYMAAYERLMNNFKPDWIKTEQVRELVSMAQGIPDGKSQYFEYIENVKTFMTLKGSNNSLSPYSKRVGKSDISVKSLIDPS